MVERGLSPCVYVHKGQREGTGIFDGSERIWMSPGFMDRSIVWGGTEGTRTIDGTEKTGFLGSTERKGVLEDTERKGVLLGTSTYVVPTTVLLQRGQESCLLHEVISLKRYRTQEN